MATKLVGSPARGVHIPHRGQLASYCGVIQTRTCCHSLTMMIVGRQTRHRNAKRVERMGSRKMTADLPLTCPRVACNGRLFVDQDCYTEGLTELWLKCLLCNRTWRLTDLRAMAQDLAHV